MLYLYSHTKAATSLLLGIFSLAENPSFEAFASKFTLAERFLGGTVVPSRIFALCGERLRDSVPKNPAKGCAHPLETHYLGYQNILNVAKFRITNSAFRINLLRRR